MVNRSPPLCTKRGATFGKHFKKHLEKMKNQKPEIQVRILKFGKMSGIFREILRISESCCSMDETSCSERRFSDVDVQGQTKTSLDLLQEVTIDDYWKMDGDKSLSEPWIGMTRFALLNNNPPEGYMWVEGRLIKRQVTMVTFVKRFTE